MMYSPQGSIVLKALRFKWRASFGIDPLQLMSYDVNVIASIVLVIVHIDCWLMLSCNLCIA